MPTLTIDGKQITVEQGTSVIEAAKQSGMEIAHYCWHPALSVAGNCRMCLVEVEKAPKLQIACGTTATDGMVVNTNTDRVKKARGGVQEFLFANHPLDCPVCDQAGECKLQDYYMLYDLKPSRMLDRKTRRVKALPIGPYIVYDAERCIACSRCVRFTDEVTKTHELGIFERGDNYYVGLAAGVELDNPYSINTADICPVGALTNRDFRFKMRVWYLSDHKSVCSGCSRGCSIKLSENKGTIYRTLPRENEQVNGHWMCDDGRFVFKRELGPSRISQPAIRRGADLDSVDWDTAFEHLYRVVRETTKEHGSASIAAVSSNQGSNEEVYLFSRLMNETLQAGIVAGKSDISPEGYQVVEDDILIRGDKNPNTMGLRIFGGLDTDPDGVVKAIKEDKVKILVVYGRGFEEALGADAPALLEKVDFVLYIGAHTPAYRVDMVLPTASWAEKEGTFTNFDGVVQHFTPAVPITGDARDDLQVFADLMERFGGERLEGAESVFVAAASALPELEGVNYRTLGETGLKLTPTPALR